jgi:hypothetical protein
MPSKIGEIILENDSRPIWEIIVEISSTVPVEEWDKIPEDASVNLDHYLYGAPKKSNEKR